MTDKCQFMEVFSSNHVSMTFHFENIALTKANIIPYKPLKG